MRSAMTENPMLHACFFSLCFIESELLPIEIYIEEIKNFNFLCSCDLEFDPMTFIYEACQKIIVIDDTFTKLLRNKTVQFFVSHRRTPPRGAVRERAGNTDAPSMRARISDEFVQFATFRSRSYMSFVAQKHQNIMPFLDEKSHILGVGEGHIPSPDSTPFSTPHSKIKPRLQVRQKFWPLLCLHPDSVLFQPYLTLIIKPLFLLCACSYIQRSFL